MTEKKKHVKYPGAVEREKLQKPKSGHSAPQDSAAVGLESPAKVEAVAPTKASTGTLVPVKENKPKAQVVASHEKSGKPKKPRAIVRWWRETVGELKRVTWPTRQETWRLTKMVLVVMFLMSALLGILDFVFSKLVTLIMS